MVNQCTDIYDELYTCNGGGNDGKLYTGAADCPGGSCVNGPAAVRPGNPAYLCSNAYTGICYVGTTPTGTWTGSFSDGSTIYTGDACILKMHEKFCGDITVPPVTDPTDLPSDTSEFDNLPAIISDMGVEAQLGQPFDTLTVRIKDLSASPVQPAGLVQEFSGLIRMGAVSFDYNGSATECGRKVCSNSFTTTCATHANCTEGGLCITPVPCPNLCSTDTNVTCSTNLDCPSPASPTCNATTAGTTNLDGAKVISYIGDPTGDHASGLVREELSRAVASDAAAFDGVMAAYRMQKGTPEEALERTRLIQQATLKATHVPLEVASMAVSVMEMAVRMVEQATANAMSDAGVAFYLGKAALAGAGLNVCMNLISIQDFQVKQEIQAKVREYEAQAVTFENRLRKSLKERGGLQME